MLRYRQFLQTALACALTLACGAAPAEPQGGRIVGGKGSIQTGKDTVVQQSSRDLVVDWERFDVGKDESVHFQQESASHSVLNRIYDHKPSEIEGRITARGRVWLLNPSGVFFGQGARVSVGSLVASGLWMEKEDFLAGRYVLSRRGGMAGAVRNAGLLEAAGGGIGLAGGAVSNEGQILARQGRVTLATGERMTVMDFAGDGLLRFALEEGTAGAVVSNEGAVEGGGVALGLQEAEGIFRGVVNNGGAVRAVAVDEQGGAVSLVGAQVKQTGRIVAQGSDTAGAAGADASGAVGTVELRGDAVSHGGEIEVSGATGGTALLEAGDTLEVSGSAQALGETGAGGDIRLLGERVNLRAGASADASGATQGGAVRVGGGWQGLERGVRNAWETLVERDVSLRADGGRGADGRGDGGEVVVWSDGTTRFAGWISARGGARGGDGGRAEVSGREHLYMRGLADLRAPRGRAGRLLLDPGRVDLCHEGTTGCDMAAATPDDTDGPDRFSDSQLATMLGMSNVTVATSAASTGDEDIVVASDFDLNWTTANTLTLDAGQDIRWELGPTFLVSGVPVTGTGRISASMGALVLNFGRLLSLGDASRLRVSNMTATGGASGTQTISGPRGGIMQTQWTVTGGGAGSIRFGEVSFAEYTLSFSGVENLVGSRHGLGTFAGGDSFTVSGAHTGDLFGSQGLNTFSFNAALTGSVTGGNDVDQFVFNGGSVTGTVAGGAGADGVNTDTLNFSGLTTAVSVSLSGVPDADGFGGSVSGGAEVGAFSGIGRLLGSTAATDDRLTAGLSVGGAWMVGSSDSYNTAPDGLTTRTLVFSNIEDLQGGSMEDTFVVSGAHTGDLMGGGGADAFNLNAALTGTANGEAGDDTFILGALGSASLGLDGGGDTDTLEGRDAAATWTLATGNIYASGTLIQSFSNIEDLQGGTGADAFTVSAAHTGDLMGGGGADAFTLTAALTGGLSGEGGADYFNLDAGGSVSGGIAGGQDADTFDFKGGTVMGAVSGGAGADILNFGSSPAGVELTLRLRPDATGFAGEATSGAAVGAFAGIDRVNGSRAAMNRVTGLGAGGAFQGDATNPTGYAFGGHTLALSGFGSTLASAADVLDLSAQSGDLQVSLSGAGASGYSGSWRAGGGAPTAFTDVREIRGGLSAADALTGRDAVASWRLGLGAQGGTYASADSGAAMRTLFFIDLESQQGGTQADEFTVSGAYAGDLMGGGGADVFTVAAALTGSLAGEGGADTFDLNAGGSVSGSIQGGAGADTFDLNAGGSVSGSIQGGTGADTFTLDAAVTGAVNGGGEDDIFTLNAFFSGSAGLDGGGGTDTLTGKHAVSTWTLALGGNTYASGALTQSFSNIENLQGGLMADTFTVNTAHTGDLMGGGVAAADIFTLTAALTGSLLGEGGADVFNLNTGGSVSGDIAGGMGADTFDFNGGTVIGAVSGGAGADVLDFAGSLTAVTVSLSGTPSADGFDGVVSGGATVSSFTDIGEVRGGAVTADRLTGLDAAASWVLGTSDGYFSADSGGMMRVLFFSGMEDLQGGSMADAFTVSGAHTGDLHGGSGADTFNLNAALTGMANGEAGADRFTLGASGSASGGLDGGGDTDTLEGLDAAATWTLAAGNTYASGTLMQSFSNIEDLQGGTAADTFTVSGAHTGELMGGGGADEFTLTAELTGGLSGEGGADVFNLNAGGSVSGGIAGGQDADTFDFNGGTVKGAVSGGAGADVLDFAGLPMAVSVSLSGTPSADGFDGSVSGGAVVGFSGTSELRGSAAATTDRLTGLDAGASWALGASDSYASADSGGAMRTLSFSGMEDLQGGSMADAFTVSGAHTGDLIGGAGADTFNLNAALTGNLMGEGGADTFTLNTGGSVSGGVSGGLDADTFDFNGGTVTGTVYGGAGADVLDFSGLAAAVELTLRGRPAATGFVGEATGGAAVGVFAGIGEVRGGAATADRVTGLGAGGSFQGMATDPTGYAFGGHTLALSGFESTLAGAADVLDLSAQ
ncbi:MAG: filamentous hemagglutinin N-terminal domain-containing protein, partial [Gammaproteobacteria bacterium]|nr:filamentous hemagglutinin N-terminal domain-containing protein [Gammaproteobacteria bacterium]